MKKRIAERPTVVFVHGSWHTPAHFVSIRRLFEEAGYPTACTLQPSAGSPPPIGLTEDAQCIQDQLKELIIVQGRDVVVVAHSYGGVVATEALEANLAKRKRLVEGDRGGVVQLVYVAAFLLPPKYSISGAFGGALPPWINVDDRGMCMPGNPKFQFYHDLSEKDQQYWANELRPLPVTALQTPITNAAYLYHPTTYVLCEDDMALPVDIQEMMIKKVITDRGIFVNKEYCNSSHVPFLGKPRRVLQVVEQLCSEFDDGHGGKSGAAIDFYKARRQFLTVSSGIDVLI